MEITSDKLTNFMHTAAWIAFYLAENQHDESLTVGACLYHDGVDSLLYSCVAVAREFESQHQNIDSQREFEEKIEAFVREKFAA